MKKRKKEYTLEEIFRLLKPGMVMANTGNASRNDVYRSMHIKQFFSGGEDKTELIDRFLRWKSWPYLFMLTRPFTNLNKKDYQKLVYNWEVIRNHRKKNREDLNKQKIKMATKPGRLFPLSEEKYKQFAFKIWEREDRIRFNKQKIDEIIFGDPVLKFAIRSITRHGTYYSQKIDERKIGVMILKNKENKFKLFPMITICDFKTDLHLGEFLDKHNINYNTSMM